MISPAPARTRRKINLATGTTWKMRFADGYISAVAKASGQYAFQEFFAFREMDGDWTQTDYDDSSWNHPNVCKVVGCMPCHSFEPRGMPLLTRMKRDSVLVRTVAFQSCLDWEKRENLMSILSRDKWDWDAQGQAEIYDFGSEITGIPFVAIDADSDGAVVDLITFEAMDGNAPRLCSAGLNSICFAGRLICQKGDNTHTFTMPWGFRYVLAVPRCGKKLAIAAAETHAVGKRGFRSGMEIENKICQMCHEPSSAAWSMPRDCPGRDRPMVGDRWCRPCVLSLAWGGF